MKLEDYSLQEKQAVFDHFFGGTNVQYDDLTEIQFENIMKSFNGSKIVLKMRVREYWVILTEILRERRR
jgi:hypothetical protein